LPKTDDRIHQIRRCKIWNGDWPHLRIGSLKMYWRYRDRPVYQRAKPSEAGRDGQPIASCWRPSASPAPQARSGWAGTKR